MIETNELSFLNILDSISFSMPASTTLAIVGHNGAGKTTLFHVLLGLKFKTKGSFKLQEKKFGYVPERPYLEMEETLHSFLKMHLKLIAKDNISVEEEITRVTTLVGLQSELNKKFKFFSKGMLQKVLLAQAMLASPKLIFLDEPMSGLDPESRKELMNHLLYLKSIGVALIFTSHVMEDVALLADHILVLDHGKQKYFGTINGWNACFKS